MTVKELIAELSKFPEDMRVFSSYDNYGVEINSVSKAIIYLENDEIYAEEHVDKDDESFDGECDSVVGLFD